MRSVSQCDCHCLMSGLKGGGEWGCSLNDLVHVAEWIPAFAGMTTEIVDSFVLNSYCHSRVCGDNDTLYPSGVGRQSSTLYHPGVGRSNYIPVIPV